MSEENQIVYSAHCVWWDSIDKVGFLEAGGVGNVSINPSGNVDVQIHKLPCCPHCQSVLFQMSESEWNVGVAKHNETHPGYSDFIAWLRGKCFPTQDAAQVVYESEKNPVIDFRNLLKKYMQHVVDQEGTAFLHREPFEENLFSTEELKVLQAIELENS